MPSVDSIRPVYFPDSLAPARPDTPPSLVARIQAFFARIRQSFTYRDTAHKLPIVTEAGKATANFVKSPIFIQAIQPFVQQPGQANQINWMANAHLMKTVGKVRLGVAVGMIAATYTLIAQGIEIHSEIVKGRWREGIDAGLSFVEAGGALADSTVSFTIGLSMMEAVKASQILWVTPLAMVAAGLSTASAALETRGWRQSSQILKMLKNQDAADNWGALTAQRKRFKQGQIKDELQVRTLDRRLRWIYEEVTNEKRDADFFLRRHFGVINREKYSAQILHLILDRDKQHLHEPLLTQLKKRTQDKIASHKVGLISAVISIIALLILFLPGAPVAVGMLLLAISGVLGVMRFGWDYRSIRRLEKWLDANGRFNDISEDFLRKHAPYAIPQSPFRHQLKK